MVPGRAAAIPLRCNPSSSCLSILPFYFVRETVLSWVQIWQPSYSKEVYTAVAALPPFNLPAKLRNNTLSEVFWPYSWPSCCCHPLRLQATGNQPIPWFYKRRITSSPPCAAAKHVVKLYENPQDVKCQSSKSKLFTAMCKWQWKERLLSPTRKSWEDSGKVNSLAGTSWVKEEHNQTELQPPSFQGSLQLVRCCREASFSPLAFALPSCFQIPSAMRRQEFFLRYAESSDTIKVRNNRQDQKTKRLPGKKKNQDQNPTKPGSKEREGGNLVETELTTRGPRV